MLAAYAGLRVSEIARLRGEDVDVEHGLLVVRGGKGNKDATVPLAGELLAELQTWPTWASCSRPATATSSATGSSPASSVSASSGAARTMRHSFGTECAGRSKGNMRKVQRLMRHASLRSTEQYVDYWPDGGDVVDGLYGDAA